MTDLSEKLASAEFHFENDEQMLLAEIFRDMLLSAFIDDTKSSVEARESYSLKHEAIILKDCVFSSLTGENASAIAVSGSVMLISSSDKD